MIIKTSNFKKYNGFISSIVSPANQFHKSLYFNFDEKTAYFFNDTIQGRIKFDFEGEICKNKFIDYTLLSNVMNMTNDIEYDDEQFKIGKDVFKIPSFEDEFPLKNFDKFEDKIDIKLTTNFLTMLKKVNSVIPINDDQKKDLQGVFIRDKKLVVSDKLRFVDLTIGDTNNIDISYDLLRLINLCSGNEKFELYENSTGYKVIIDDILEIIISKTINLELKVDMKSEKFRSNFESNNKFTIDKSKLKDGLNTIKVFASSASKDEIIIEVNETSISLIIDDPINKIYTKKDIEVEEVSNELIGVKVKTKYTFLTELLNMFNAEKYNFCINPEAVAFDVVDAVNGEDHVVIVKK